MTIDRSSKHILEKAWLGKELTLEDANTLIDPALTDLYELTRVSGAVTRRHFGNKVEMCAIYPAKVGLCSGDCAYCAQSAHHKTDVMLVAVNELNDDEIVANANELWRQGVSRYSLVTSGECLTDEEFAHILHILNRLDKETEIGLCASLGSLTMERALMLKDVGVSRYHHNIETSRSFFSCICSTHTYDDKLETLAVARQAGLEICCGGILSMGETPKQRVEMAFVLRDLNVHCIPINILNPIPGTRLEKQQILSVEDIMRTIAVFRLILPNKPLRFAGGRESALGESEYAGYAAGINAMLVGNYLTTPGKPIEQEFACLKRAGLAFK